MIDCGKQLFYIVQDREQATISFVYTYSREERTLDGGATNREDFTSHLEAKKEVSVSSKSTEEEFELKIMDNGRRMNPS